MDDKLILRLPHTDDKLILGPTRRGKVSESMMEQWAKSVIVKVHEYPHGKHLQKMTVFDDGAILIESSPERLSSYAAWCAAHAPFDLQQDAAEAQRIVSRFLEPPAPSVEQSVQISPKTVKRRDTL